MRISAAIHQQMIDHALADAPDECCGMVAARDGEAVAAYPISNAAHSPLRYEMDPREQLAVEFGEIYDRDLEVGIIYHSHTRSAPYPSQTDINLATHPEAIYVIVGVKDREHPEVRGYRIRDGEVTEVALEIIDAAV
ncbi:Mov34/MPN/PAD-1 family protein [Conexibacter sp. DBS9H8]|uniref:Mov34/MPN/PAD-1 family protein n=1 Tax=Conexibacter sp. DBS9H8 TaxID=2937801 RepID=UPI00200D1C76|nr:M67 family metallopeptidase [Conexibacter sp. DBS9H8]